MRRASVSRYVLQYFLFKDDYSNIQVVLSHIIFFLMQNTRTAYFDRLSSAALAAVSNPQRANYSAADVVLLSGCGLQEVRTWTVCMSYNMFVIIFEERVIATVVHNENTHTLVLRAVVCSKKRLSYSTSTVVISIVSCVVVVEGVLVRCTSGTDPPPHTHTTHTSTNKLGASCHVKCNQLGSEVALSVSAFVAAVLSLPPCYAVV